MLRTVHDKKLNTVMNIFKFSIRKKYIFISFFNIYLDKRILSLGPSKQGNYSHILSRIQENSYHKQAQQLNYRLEGNFLSYHKIQHLQDNFRIHQGYRT